MERWKSVGTVRSDAVDVCALAVLWCASLYSAVYSVVEMICRTIRSEWCEQWCKGVLEPGALLVSGEFIGFFKE